MKPSSVTALLLSLVVHVATAGSDGGDDIPRLHPARISYQDLVDADDTSSTEQSSRTLMDALASTGMIAVTDIPGIKDKEKTMANLHHCMMESSNKEAVQVHTFPDGSIRRTLATKTIPGPGGVQPILPRNKSPPSSPACKTFEEAGKAFRSTVASVTQAFADRLTEYLDIGKRDEPLLETEDGFSFPTFGSVVENGDHLEHFHSYQKFDNHEEATIEMHTDQGLFIVFTPGRMLDLDHDKEDELTSGFWIEQADGTAAQVFFESTDDLVIMLGDGVNQIPINDRLMRRHQKLRAVPHALSMDPHDDTQARVWYGRMVLAPHDAVHPTHQVTFGDLRQGMIDASLRGNKHDDNNDRPSHALHMGCSDGRVARDLSAITCEDDQIFCWHRCMNSTFFPPIETVSKAMCKSRGLEMLCINPRLQISEGDMHGDFYPACADPAVQETVTSFPALPEYPRSEETCTDESFEQFVNETAYDHSYQLPGDATFLWSIEDDAYVKGRLVYDGLFGFLAFGFSYVEGQPRDTHHSATMIMAVPGGNYSAFSGLDLTMEPTIADYVMPGKSPFRMWSEPVVAAAAPASVGFESYKIESNDCFTALSFKTDAIHNIRFNLTGTDELVWAGNGEDYFMAGHGKAVSRFAIDWPTGEVTIRKSKRTFGGADAASSSAAVLRSSGWSGLIMLVIAFGANVVMSIF